MFSGPWDRTPYAMEARILRPLLWFGLLEHRSEKMPGDRFVEHHFYRKAANRPLSGRYRMQSGHCGDHPVNVASPEQFGSRERR